MRARTVAAVVCFLMLCIDASLAGDAEKAQEAFEHCDYNTAMSIWRTLAERGDATAAHRVASQYWSGLFVPEDRNEATKWFNVEARLLRKRADDNDAAAELALGTLYLEGQIGVNYTEAMKWFLKAADQGNPRAISEIGEFYAWGWGVPRDGEKALEWYRKAANTGDPWAQDNLGWMLGGEGAIREDDKEAAIWIRKAAEQHYPSAEAKLAGMYFAGQSVPKSEDEGLHWLKRAANHSLDEKQAASDPLGFAIDVQMAASRLGDAYRDGRLGVIPYGPEAVRWYSKAAELGDSISAVTLGRMYLEGTRVPKDYAEAAKWFEKGGGAAGAVELGRMYRDGLGVPQDYVLAYMWFNLAAPYLFGDTARRERDELSAKMSAEHVNKAQQLTKERSSHCVR